MPLVKNAGKRHRIIDALLSGKRRLLTRDEFLEIINRKLDPDEQITVHTLDKDIKDIKEKIQDRGVDIRRTHIRGYHYTREGFSLYKNEVNEDDKNLLLLASSVFSLFNGTPIQDKFGQLVEKVLSESMIAGRAGELSQQQLVELGAGPPVKGSQWISPLLDAILKKETLEMVYKSSFKNAKKKHICPYLIKKYQHRWFLIAYDHNCERADKTNTFALDCIESLDISNKAYISDPDFKPEDFFRYTIGIWHYHRASPIKVQLEFTGHINEIMSAPLHHSQKTILSDDLKKLQVEIEVYHSPELKTLILGYGAAVRVLHPRELANEIAHEAGKIGNSYH